MKKFKRLLSLAVVTALLISSVAFNVSAQVDEKVLFTDDFENGAGNWNVQSGSTGVIDSELSFEKYYTTSATGVDELAYNNLSQSHIVTNTVFNISQWNTEDATSYVATHIRYTDADNNYRLAYYPASNKLAIASIVGGVETELTSATIPALLADTDYTFTLAMCEKSVRAEINGTVYLAFYDLNATLEGGGIAFSTNNQSAVVKSVKADKETKLVHLNFGSGNLFKDFATRKSGGLMYDSAENALKIYRDGTAGLFGICDTYEISNGSYGYAIRNNPMWENTNLIVRFKRKAAGSGGNFYLNSRYVYISEEGVEAMLDKNGTGNSLVYKRSAAHGSATTGTNEGFLGDAWHKVELKTMTTAANTTNVQLALDNTLINEITVTDIHRAGGGIQLKTDGYAEIYVSDIVLERVSPETGEPVYTSFYHGFNKGDEAWIQKGDAVGGEFISNEAELDSNLNKCYITEAETNLPLVLNNKEWNNIAVSADLKSDDWNNAEASFAGIAARYVDDKNYIVYKYSDYNAENSAKGTVSIAEIVNGNETVVTSASVDKFAADKHTVKLEVKNGMYRGYVDGKIVLAVERPYTYTIGSIALVSNNQAAKFDNVVVNGERDYYYQNFELPFDGMNINTDLKLYTANNNAVYGTDPATGNGVLVGGSEETTGNFYQSFNTNYTSLSENPWSHIGFNVRLKPTTWNGMEVIPRIQNRHSSGIYKLMFEKSGDEYKVYFHRNIDDLVVATGLLTAADVTYLTPKADRVTTNLLTDGEYALICAEAQDNTDGSVTLRAYINGTLITEVTDYGPSQAVKDKLASDKPNWGGNGPITATLSNGTATVSVASSKKGVWYLDEVWIEDMSAVENLTPELSFDKEELTANETVTCTMTAVNNTFETASAELIVALYSEDGKVLDFVSPSKTLTLKPGETGSETIPVTLPADVTGLKLRAFAWSDLETLTPLADVIALPEN